jgi:hypothetical protein
MWSLKTLQNKTRPPYASRLLGWGWQGSVPRGSKMTQSGVGSTHRRAALWVLCCVVCCDRSGQAYDVGPVFGPWSSGLMADSSASRRDFRYSTRLGEKMTMLPGVRSSVIVGVNSGWSSIILGIVSLQHCRGWHAVFAKNVRCSRSAVEKPDLRLTSVLYICQRRARD